MTLSRNCGMGDSDLAADWATIWQSEFAALAADREWPEWGAHLLAFWAALAHGSAGAAPGAAPVAAAPDVAELTRRVAELERRLAGREPS